MDRKIRRDSGNYRKSSFRRKTYRKRAPTAFRGRRRTAYRRKSFRPVRRVAPRRTRMSIATPLSVCGLEYLRAQYDPWHCKEPPCVPDAIAIPSYKFSTFIRGTMKIAAPADSIGYVFMNPYSIANSVAASVNNTDYIAPVWATNGVIGSPDYSNRLNLNIFTNPSVIIAGVDKVVTPFYWNSQVSGLNMVQELTANTFNIYCWRPVGGGIKMQYSGVADSRQGQYILWEDPQNSPYVGATSLVTATLLQNAEAKFTVVDDKQVAVTYHPRNMNDFQYSDNWYNNPATANASDLAQYHTMGIIVQGNPGGTYTFECVMHWEMTGSAVPSRSKSHAASGDMDKVANVAETQPSVLPPEDVLKHKLGAIIREGGTNRPDLTTTRSAWGMQRRKSYHH